VRGHSRLGDHVHGLGPHLKLHVDTGRADQRGVERLVAVELGDGDVVLEAAGNRLVHLMKDTERRVAIRHGGDDDPESVDVGHLGKAQVLFIHLPVDGVQGLFASGDPTFIPVSAKAVSTSRRTFWIRSRRRLRARVTALDRTA
jgi:hypothetical protein